MPNPALLALVGILFVLLLAPTRRLQLAGWSSRALATYLGSMLLLGFLVAELRGPARFLVPILVIGYLAPFVTLRSGLDRLRGRDGQGGHSEVRVERPPVKSVSGPARDVRPGEPGEREEPDEPDEPGGSEGRTSRSG